MRIKEQKAITLTELLVASILIGIVMVGVMAVSYAIKSMQDTTNKGAILSMRTTATMNHISKNVALAIGYKDDPGIVVDIVLDGHGEVDPALAEWFAVRQGSGVDFTRYDDDIWVVYYKENYQLKFCTQDDVNLLPDCSGPFKVVSQDIIDTEFQFSHEMDPDLTLSGNPEFYLRVYLKTQYDPGGAFDLIDNPHQEVTSRISPLGHSW